MRIHTDAVRTRIEDPTHARPITSTRDWLEVGDVMNTDVTSIAPDATVLSAAKIMAGKRISCIVVVDGGDLVGILTETDFLKRIAGNKNDFDKRTVAEIMSAPVQSVGKAVSVLKAAEIMQDGYIKRLPVVEDGRLVGIITQTDLVRTLTSYGVWRDVSEIMCPDVAAAQRTATVSEAAGIMTARHVSCVVVLDGEAPAGILTERDLLEKVVSQHRDPTNTMLQEVMSSPVVHVPPSYSVFSAGRSMEAKGIRRLLVMDHDRLCGIVAQTDVFRAAKGKLQAEEDENLRLLENSEYGIFTADLDGRVTYVNPAFLGLFDASDPREFVGDEFLPDRYWDRPADRIGVHAQLGKENVRIRALLLKTTTGRPICATLYSCPTRNARGEISGTQGILYDTTDEEELEALREVQEALQAANEALRQSSEATRVATRAKSEFLANMSHEIRTPMTAILGFAEALLEGLEDEQQRDAAEAIQRNGEHLLRLINDILDLSKVEAGKMQTERVPCSPVEVVAEALSPMRGPAESKNLELALECPGPIPATIRSDPLRLRQILLNLLSNAVRFTETGGVRLVVRAATTASRAPCLRFDVIDTGIGMSPTEVSRLFQPFTQADSSTSRRFGGTGLGLTISRRLAEALGGGIAVKTILGHGSTFTLTVATGPLEGVPMLDDPAAAVQAIRPRPTPSETPEVKLDCRVLVAEDGPDNQRLLRLVLEKAGADVTVAENGRDAYDSAVAAAAGEPFDVILMDMQMPILDGYDATRKLRAEGYEGPIIALTANAMLGDRQKCLDAGCDDYLSKPIQRDRFLSLIARHANKRQEARSG